MACGSHSSGLRLSLSIDENISAGIGTYVDACRPAEAECADMLARRQGHENGPIHRDQPARRVRRWQPRSYQRTPWTSNAPTGRFRYIAVSCGLLDCDKRGLAGIQYSQRGGMEVGLRHAAQDDCFG